MLLEMQPMLLQWQKIKPNIDIYIPHIAVMNSTVAIGNPERNVRKASHRGSKQQ